MMLRPELSTDHHREFVYIDGVRHILTTWDHLQATCGVIEAPRDGWGVGHVGNVRYAAAVGSGGK